LRYAVLPFRGIKGELTNKPIQKNYIMKQLGVLMLFLSALVIVSCDKDEDEVSEKFKLLTGIQWESEALQVNGVDASGEGQLLENFKGDVDFNEDGTGSFGQYTGTWEFTENEEMLVIKTVIAIEETEIPVTLNCLIIQLTSSLLEISTEFPNFENPQEPLNIEMTFRAK
jgi:hypothetical protein